MANPIRTDCVLASDTDRASARAWRARSVQCSGSLRLLRDISSSSDQHHIADQAYEASRGVYAHRGEARGCPLRVCAVVQYGTVCGDDREMTAGRGLPLRMRHLSSAEMNYLRIRRSVISCLYLVTSLMGPPAGPFFCRFTFCIATVWLRGGAGAARFCEVRHKPLGPAKQPQLTARSERPATRRT